MKGPEPTTCRLAGCSGRGGPLPYTWRGMMGTSDGSSTAGSSGKGWRSRTTTVCLSGVSTPVIGVSMERKG